jgi:hypothetical protein
VCKHGFLKLQHQSIITFFIKGGNKSKVIHEWLLAVCGDNASFIYQVKYLSEECKWGIESINDDHHLGRPVLVSKYLVVITPPSVFGIDRRIAYANRKYHSG